MASLCGFVVGVASLKIMMLLGGSAELQMGWVLTLVPFAGFAIVGGAVTSVLYRRARRRLHR